MSTKYGLNQFKNTNDDSTSVIIEDGKLKELGVPLGEVSENSNGVYIVDPMGRKTIVPIQDAIVQAINLMSDEVKEAFKSSVFGEIDVLPASITGVVPFMLTNEDLGAPTDFIFYGKNMHINDTVKTAVSLVDKDTLKEYKALSWNPINTNQIQASFKIPNSCTTSTFMVSIKFGDIQAESTAEIILNKDITYETQELEFKTTGEEFCIETTPDSILFSPLFNNNIGADSVSVVSDVIDGTKNFVLSADLRINTRSGATLNAIDLTRSGFGLGHSGESGEIRFSDVNLDIRDFKPRFNTFQTKDSIKHVKFIKHGKTLYKLLYSDDCVYTSKMILTDTDNITVCASMQRLDDTGSILSVSYNNIKLKTY